MYEKLVESLFYSFSYSFWKTRAAPTTHWEIYHLLKLAHVRAKGRIVGSETPTGRIFWTSNEISSELSERLQKVLTLNAYNFVLQFSNSRMVCSPTDSPRQVEHTTKNPYFMQCMSREVPFRVFKFLKHTTAIPSVQRSPSSPGGVCWGITILPYG